MKKKIVLLSLSLGCVVATSAVALSFANFDSTISKAEEELFTITLEADDITSATAFTDVDVTAYTDQLHNPVTFEAAKVKKSGDYVEFKGSNDGHFGNKSSSPIYAMRSMELFFKEDNPASVTRIEWGWEDSGVIQYPYYSNIYSTDPDGYRFVFDDDKPDYFRIVNNDESDDSLFVKKLIITYGNECKTETSHGDPYRSINKLTYKNKGDHWSVMGFASSSDKLTDLVFESEIEDLPVTEIEHHAFYWESEIESVSFSGSNITTVGGYSFYVCGALTTVDFRNSNVVTLGDYCFCSSSNLANVYGLDLIEVFSENCLAGTGITSVTFGDNLRRLDGTPFYGTNSITSVTFSDVCEPEHIDSGAFNWCEGIEYVHIGSLMTSLPDFYMSPIKAYSIGPDPVHFKVDEDGVLYSKYTATGYYLKRIPMGTELTSYVMPDYVEYCLSEVAEGCSSLQSVTINNKVFSIGSEAFHDCVNLTTVNFESDSDLHYINNDAFNNCEKLASITLPSTITNIGNDVFKNCTSLTTFTIPHNISSMGCAFAGCSNIATIYYDGTVEEWNTRPIYKYSEWYSGISATVLTCTDDTIPIQDAD